MSQINYEFKDSHHYLIKGENGIGKSTLFRSILHQIHFEGEIEIHGRIAYGPEEAILPAYMSVKFFIRTFSTLIDDVPDIDFRINEMLMLFGLQGTENKELGALSRGQKEKVNLIQALLTPSEILLLDEPLSSLDSESKKALMSLLKLEKRLVIVVSHETSAFRHKDFTILRLEEGRLREISTPD